MEQPAILSDQKIQTWKAKLQKWNFQQNGQNDFIKTRSKIYRCNSDGAAMVAK